MTGAASSLRSHLALFMIGRIINMTHAQKMLMKIEKELEGLELATQSYSIGSRAMNKRRIDELTRLRTYYQNELCKEKLKQKLANGEQPLSFETRFEKL